jgi:putative FmdB family regulatory protein
MPAQSAAWCQRAHHTRGVREVKIGGRRALQFWAATPIFSRRTQKRSVPMPIYEYQCETCGMQREVFVRTADAPRPSCPTCRKRMRRVISQTAFILKGSGWYVTDYPSESRKKGMEGEKAPAAPAAAEEKKNESAKPAPAAAAPAPPGPAAGKARKKKA